MKNKESKKVMWWMERMELSLTMVYSGMKIPDAAEAAKRDVKLAKRLYDAEFNTNPKGDI